MAPRPVYMNSDLIKGAVPDLTFIKTIGKTLDFYGVPWKAFSYQTSPHYAILKEAPSNAVILHNSLMDPGVIVDICTDSYKVLRAKRKFLYNFYTETEDYAFTVDHLKRADDDNYDPPSFKGLNQPVQYMVKNGGFNVSSTIDPRKIGRQLAMLAYQP